MARVLPPPSERFDPVTARWVTPGGPLHDPERDSFDPDHGAPVKLVGPIPRELADADGPGISGGHSGAGRAAAPSVGAPRTCCVRHCCDADRWIPDRVVRPDCGHELAGLTVSTGQTSLGMTPTFTMTTYTRLGYRGSPLRGRLHLRGDIAPDRGGDAWRSQARAGTRSTVSPNPAAGSSSARSGVAGNQLRAGRHQPIPTDVSAEVADARLLGERGINIKSLTGPDIDTTTPWGERCSGSSLSSRSRAWITSGRTPMPRPTRASRS